MTPDDETPPEALGDRPPLPAAVGRTQACPCGASEIRRPDSVTTYIVATPAGGLGMVTAHGKTTYVCVSCGHPLGAVPASAEALERKGN